jgi:hypothetical protein
MCKERTEDTSLGSLAPHAAPREAVSISIKSSRPLPLPRVLLCPPPPLPLPPYIDYIARGASASAEAEGGRRSRESRAELGEHIKLSKSWPCCVPYVLATCSRATLASGAFYETYFPPPPAPAPRPRPSQPPFHTLDHTPSSAPHAQACLQIKIYRKHRCRRRRRWRPRARCAPRAAKQHVKSKS